MTTRPHHIIVLAIAAFAVLNALSAEVGHAQSLAPGLENKVEAYQSGASDDQVSVVIFMGDNVLSQPGRMPGNSSTPRAARIKQVLNKARSFRSSEADAVADVLAVLSSTEVVRHWIVPAFSATIPISGIDRVASMNGVRLVVENVALNYDPPIESVEASPLATSVSPEKSMLNIPYLWQRGLKGAGRLICSFDTGVEQSHPALSDKWRGNHASLESCWFSKVAPDTLPYDAANHGTHTMGIMVGGTAADTFGVAPEAEWITAGVIDQGRPLATTLSDIIEAFQWALNPDGDTSTTDDVPDVILNSWGVPKGLFAPCDDTFADVIDVVEAAGIVTIFAAGNEGPTPMTLRNPADMATSPLTTFAVGAVDDSKLVAAFSSRGPSSCDATHKKPEVVAPGVGVYSSQKGGGYAYMTGTSMAAPFVAGMVALMRQYNPDATVEEIKNALILSAEDLGDAGEDNAYGYGLPDASRLLDFLPAPFVAEFDAVGEQISDDGIAWPGETVGLQVALNVTSNNIYGVVGRLESLDGEAASVTGDSADFYFGMGVTSTTNFNPFSITIDSEVTHGREVPFRMIIKMADGPVIDTVEFELTVGVAPAGDIATHYTDGINFSVSDFGQFGFAPGSIYNLGGAGFAFEGGGPPYLLKLSSSVRDSAGRFRASDFAPVDRLSSTALGGPDCIRSSAALVDIYSPVPIPITLTQEVTTYESDGIVMMKFYLVNKSLERLTDLHFGFMADFDLEGPGSESLTYDAAMDVLCQETTEGAMVGLVPLHNISGVTGLANGSAKSGMSRAMQHDLISSDSFNPGLESGDLYFVTGSRDFTIEPGDSVVVAFALVAAYNRNNLYANATIARERFGLATAVDDDAVTLLPDGVTLHQNYPNPFNPTTTIAFDLPVASDVSLVVYNSLGQKVAMLADGRMSAGRHSIDWNGTADGGSAVASGVYFYRLATDHGSHSKKMLLLK